MATSSSHREELVAIEVNLSKAARHSKADGIDHALLVACFSHSRKYVNVGSRLGAIGLRSRWS
jgi:hypothetical protein